MDKYEKGYPKVAAIQASDPNFLLYKKFAWLHNRVILSVQDELMWLQKRLVELDGFDSQNDWRKLISRRRDWGLGTERKYLMHEIEEKLEKFGI